MHCDKLSIEKAIKFIDAQSRLEERPTLESIGQVVDWINRLLHDERQFGVGTPEEQYELFEYLVSVSRNRSTGGADTLAKLMMAKWSEKSQNLYAVAYHVGHMDGNINGSFHAIKRGLVKDKKMKQRKVGRAADGRRFIGTTSREKVRKAAQAFRHLSKESAAPKIAEVVKLSTGTVKRYLSDIFPGSDWAG